MDLQKIPPHSIEAEQSVLGGLLINNEAWDNIAGKISSVDFYRHDHRVIFKATLELIESNNPCDIITLSDHLKQQNKLEEAGGFTYIGNLANNTPSASNIKAYAEIVRERSIFRQLITIGSEITDDAFNPEGRASQALLEEAEKKVFDIADQTNHKNSQNDFFEIKELLKNNVDRIEALISSKDAFTGLPTKFKELDKMTSGLQAADLIIIAGRPSMGKTTFAMNIAENAAINTDKHVAVFSMEMPAESLTLRMLSSLGRIDQTKLRSGKLDAQDLNRLTSAMSILNTAHIYIDDTPALSPSLMKAKVRRLKRKNPVDLIVIDYLQLMQSQDSGRKNENRTNEISEISRGLKALAKEMNVPVIALSQLNRSLEQRSDKRPIMSDLRESGAIEQDADVIMFIYRDEVYTKEESEHKGMAEVIIGKQRNGPLGTAHLSFCGQFTRFDNPASEEYDNYS